MDKFYYGYCPLLIVLILLACQITQLAPTPAPTATATAMATATSTPTPVVIIVTATPVPTPTVDLYSLVFVPRELERFAGQLVPLHGYDFYPAPRLAVTRDTIFYWGYESPIGSGQFYVARYGIVDDQWLLLDTKPMETPTPEPTRTPSLDREAWRGGI